jgi:hypothetical protein
VRAVTIRLSDELAEKFIRVAETTGCTYSSLLCAAIQWPIEEWRRRDEADLEDWDPNDPLVEYMTAGIERIKTLRDDEPKRRRFVLTIDDDVFVPWKAALVRRGLKINQTTVASVIELVESYIGHDWAPVELWPESDIKYATMRRVEIARRLDVTRRRSPAN